MEDQKKRKNERGVSSYTFWITLGIIAFAIILLGISIICQLIKPTKGYENVTYQDIIGNCSNKSLINASECINQHIQKVYKFAVTNDNVSLTFDELKSKGGDCKDWSELYLNLTSEMGFNSQDFKIFIKNNKQNMSMYHEFVLAYNYEGYVIFDGQKLLVNQFI